MKEVSNSICGVFQNEKCLIAAKITIYEKLFYLFGKCEAEKYFEVKQNGFFIYKGSDKRKAFNLFNNISLSLQKMARNAEMNFKEW